MTIHLPLGIAAILLGLIHIILAFPREVKAMSGQGRTGFLIRHTSALLGYGLWTAYGWQSNDPVLAFGQGLGVLYALVLCIHLLWHKNNGRP